MLCWNEQNLLEEPEAKKVEEKWSVDINAALFRV